MASEAANAHRRHTYRLAWLHHARLTFRRWRRSRPFWAGFWTLLGATLIAYVPATAYQFLFATTSIALGIAVGAIIGLLGVLVWVHPAARVFYGVVIILLSLVSFVTSDFGGLFLGMLMSIVGGSLALSWVPAGYQSRRQCRRAAAQAAEAEAEAESTTIVLPDETAYQDQDTSVIDLTAGEEEPERRGFWHRPGSPGG